jgi:phage repressor protein C with HTH and peptisase S24 domain
MPSQSADDKVLEVMREIGAPMSPGEMCDELGAEYAASTVRNAMNRLAREGKLEKTGHGVYELPENAQPRPVNDRPVSAGQTDPIYGLQASMGDGTYALQEDPIGHVNGPEAMSRPGKDVFWVFVRGDSMGEKYQKHSMVPVLRFPEPELDIKQDDVYLFRLEGAIQIKRLQRLSGQRIRIISDSDSYPNETLQLDEGIDFEILGRVLV